MSSMKSIKGKDFVFVILYGLGFSVLFGILLGFIDYFIQKTGFSFMYVLYFVFANYLGIKIRNQSDRPHVLYGVITFIGLMIAWVILNSFPIVYQFAVESGDRLSAFNPSYYFEVGKLLFNPLRFINQFSFDLLLWWLFFGVGTYIGVSKTQS